MKRLIVLVILLSLGASAFAAQRAAQKNVRAQPPSSGILFSAYFDFDIVGDGISTTFTIDPRRIPPRYNGGASTFPRLPLVGIINNDSFACGSFHYAGTLSDGLITLTFATALPANVSQECFVRLLFQPE